MPINLKSDEGRLSFADKAIYAMPSSPPDTNTKSGEGQRPYANKANVNVPSLPPDPNTKSDEGHNPIADKANAGVPSSSPGSDEGHVYAADKANCPASSPLPDPNTKSGEGRASGADKATDRVPSPPPDIEQTVARIRYWHRQRVYAMEQRKRADLSLLAFLRTALGWSKALPEAARSKIAKQAMVLVAVAEAEAKGKYDGDMRIVDLIDQYMEWLDIISASLAARAPFDAIEKRAKLQMGKLAKTLPIYSWAEPMKGFGDVSLAVIVGEAGDLSNYATHSKLWKRMGVAVMGDVRQGGLNKKTASKKDWIRHGYNRERRSRLWNIGDSLIKAQVRKVLDADGEDQGERISIGDYGSVYLARKTYEFVRDPEMAPIKAHRRAQRYMEKKLLRDLWRAWTNERRANALLPEGAIWMVPSARLNEEMASTAMPPTARTPLPSPQQNEGEAASALPPMASLNAPPLRQDERHAIVELPETAVTSMHVARLNEEMAICGVPSVAALLLPSPQQNERKAVVEVLETASVGLPSARIDEGEAVPCLLPQEATCAMLPLHSLEWRPQLEPSP